MRMFRDVILVATLPVCIAVAACNDKAVAIATMSMPNGVIGHTYSYQMQGQNVSAWSISSGILPPGLQMSSTGLVSGTPTVIGTFSFVVQANQDSTPTSPTVSQALTLTITAS